MVRTTHRVGKLERTDRGFQQDVELAMGSDPLRAIIELVTNADDAYADMPGNHKGKIRVEVERHRTHRSIVVKDRATGMSPDEILERLAREGARTSGFEGGKDRRGLLGRGAKDIVNFGPAQWESVKDGTLSIFKLIYTTSPTDRWDLVEKPARSAKEHGTTVTLEVQPRFSVNTHEKMHALLRRHYALRPLLLDREGREIVLVDRNQQREDKVVFDLPRGKFLERQRLKLPGYEGQFATVTLYESDSTLDDGSPREFWQHSLLISSGRAAYEIFDGGKFSREPWALHLGRLFGFVDVPAINEFIRAYDDNVEQGLSVDSTNPLRLVKRDRSGLVPRSEHPLVDSLYSALEDFLEPHLLRLRAEAEAQDSVPVNEDTRRRLSEVGRLMGRLLKEESAEGGLEGVEGALPPPGLSMIPSVAVFEPGKEGRLLVRYRPLHAFGAGQSEPPTVVVAVRELSGDSATEELELVDRGAYFSRAFRISAHDSGDVCEVEVTLDSLTTVGYVEWRNPESSPVTRLEFEHAAYSIKEGDQRFIRLLAPWDLVINEDPHPALSLVGDPSISLVRSDIAFGLDELRNCGAAMIPVRGRGVGSRATLTARLGESVAEAELNVGSGGVSGVRIEFEELKVPQRIIMSEDGSSLRINASHPSVARYLGAKSRGWPGQNALYFRTMLAEIISWAFARHVIQARRGQERVDTYRLFYEQMTLMDKWLPRVHSVLVPKDEVGVNS